MEKYGRVRLKTNIIPREKVEDVMFIVDIAKSDVGFRRRTFNRSHSWRTDGARLSYMGLPCLIFLQEDIIFTENTNMLF